MSSVSGERSVFAFLGDETRLAILEALYAETNAPGPTSAAVAYTTLQETVGVEDSGRFNYHLDKLVGHFVSQTDAGYRLREPGREVVRILRTGTLTQEVTVGPEPVDATCYRCGGSVVVEYDRSHLITRCRDCPGLLGQDTLPEGVLTGIEYPPGSVEERGLSDTFWNAHVRFERRLGMMANGFCPECGGSVTTRLELCAEHEAEDGLCERCSLWYPALAALNCDLCGRARLTHPLSGGVDYDPVRDLLEERRAAVGWERFAELMRWPATVEDGTVTVEAPDGTRLRVDDDLSVRRID